MPRGLELGLLGPHFTEGNPGLRGSRLHGKQRASRGRCWQLAPDWALLPMAEALWQSRCLAICSGWILLS